MAKKKTLNVKARLEQVLAQAQDSIKMLGAFEKSTRAKAKSFVKIPNAKERRRLTNDRILSGLRKLGVASQAEVDTLSNKIRELETSFHRPTHNSNSTQTKNSASDAEK
jgi:hypothetical protein